MTKIENFLAKLDKINFTEVKGEESIKGEALGITFKVVLSSKMSSSLTESIAPIQAILRVEGNGEYIMSYGSISEYDNTAIIKWFKSKVYILQEKEYAEKKALREQASKAFDLL